MAISSESGPLIISEAGLSLSTESDWLDPTLNNLNWYGLYKQITLAILYRRQVVGGMFYGARVARAWAEFTAPGTVGETTLTTATTMTWRGGVGSGDPPYENPWGPGLTDIWAPISWVLVFDHCDPDKVVKTRINTWTNAGTLTYQNLRDNVTSRRIDSLADLAGRRCIIIRGDHGLWTDDLVCERPNAHEAAAGEVRTYHDDPDHPLTVTSPTHTKITDRKRTYRPDRVIGGDLLVYADDGFLKRVTVTGYADQSFQFATVTWTPAVGSNYSVVPPGRHAVPGNHPPSPFAAYRGYQRSCPASYLGTPGFVNKMAQSVEIPEWDGSACNVQTVKAVDAFVRTEDQPDPLDMACGRLPEFVYTPHVHKTLRGLQAAIEEISSSFVQMRTYTGQDHLNNLVPAAMFEQLGTPTVRLFAYTVSGTGGTNTFTFGSVGGFAPEYPIKVAWCLTKGHYGNYKAGYGQLTQTSLTAEQLGDFPTFNDDDDDAGVTLLIALGWAGFPRREFARLYPRTGFIPDVGADGGGHQYAIDPPVINYADTGCLGAGKWVRREASTKYLWARVEGVGYDAENFMLETGEVFGDTQVARYAGENFQNPNAIGLGGTPLSADDVTAPYFGYMATSHRPPEPERLWDRVLHRNQCTDASTTTTLETDQDAWLGRGVLRVEDMVAGAGSSSTQLVDSTKTTEPNRCTWYASRFINFAFPWTGFVVEFLWSGTGWDDPDAVIHRRVVATGNDAAGALSWTEALPGTCEGKTARIREPRYELNGLEGRKVVIRKRDPADPAVLLEQTRTIVANDDYRRFLDFPLPWPPDARTTFDVQEVTIGHVMKRASGAWAIATGADATRIGIHTAKPFTKNPSYNVPHYMHRYGRHCLRDVVCAHTFRQMQDALDLLQWHPLPVTWQTSALSTPTVSETNGIGAGATDCGGDYDASDTVTYIPKGQSPGVAEAHYEHASCPASSFATDVPSPPKALYKWQRQYHESTESLNPFGEYSGDTSLIAIDANWSRLVVSLPLTRGCGMGATAVVDYYVWSQVDAVDSPDGTENDSTGHRDKFTFEAGHDPFLYHKWALAASTTGADAVAGGDYQSPRIGDGRAGAGSGAPLAPGRPPAPPDPPPWDPDTSGGKTYFSYGGFYLSDQIAVVKYTFPIPAYP